MSEDKLRSESGGTLPDPVALGMALSRASSRVDEALTGYLDDQRHHLHEQLKQLHLDIWEKFLGVFLRLATAVVGVAAAGAVAWLIWDASRSNGLLIEPFNVPPDLAARGLTGEVVAARVLDRLSWMQSQTNTARPARSYANAWGEHGIKLEIPETGISLNELDNWLRQKLGHDTRVSGEIVRTSTGVSITARAADEGAETVSGSDADLDVLVNRAAESIYRLTQPYRYATYLLRHENKAAEALPIFQHLALNGSPDDRVWSYNMWAVSVVTTDGLARGLEMYRRAVAAQPDAIGAYDNLAGGLINTGRYEEALQVIKDQLVHLKNGRQRYVPPANIPFTEQRNTTSMARLLGAYGDSLPFVEDVYRTGSPGLPAANLLNMMVEFQVGAHELSTAQTNMTAFYPESDPGKVPLGILLRLDIIAAAREDWKAVLPLAGAVNRYLVSVPKDKAYVWDALAPLLAGAQARLGNVAEAERIIGPTSQACYPCLIARGQVAELAGNQPRADFWFARAAAEGPSFPFAFYEWGRVQLQRGKPDAAIAQFTIANQKGPHFADALEGWGEALMAKNQSHLALEKFAEAEKYTPNWGRLHLKWGEALAYSGKKDEAAKQFARAAALDLTPSEKSELAKVPHV